MKISYQNMHALDKLTIHDSEYSGYTYDYESRKVILSCENYYTKKLMTFVFENVILVHMQSCSFWHGGSSIMWLKTSCESEYLSQLLLVQNNNAEKFSGSYLDKEIQYMSIEITINSGDTLQIVCQSIEYTEHQLAVE